MRRLDVIPGCRTTTFSRGAEPINGDELTEAYEDNQGQVEHLQVRVAIELVIDTGEEGAHCQHCTL